jgi:NAD(P)-dependent dehydrogenase (short-subunit alcohol dehydrogenase family)
MQRMRRGLAEAQPLRRVGEATDIAHAALFLTSDDSEWLTGQGLTVDGGRTVGRPWRTQPSWARESHPIRIYRSEGR